ncbi:hypothetical protein NC653_003364 [Populus alba x Populus x berolinensis]|uniref:Uncharacterized protein n=1 Tax=Populus alba x Populus x berolinensis TaxID=444605 RepID=A0AAD6RRA4_9ROSI|nr:hypothetical protein NC653_003364 [Populus alba x Populus x berolinensis]
MLCFQWETNFKKLLQVTLLRHWLVAATLVSCLLNSLLSFVSPLGCIIALPTCPVPFLFRLTDLLLPFFSPGNPYFVVATLTLFYIPLFALFISLFTAMLIAGLAIFVDLLCSFRAFILHFCGIHDMFYLSYILSHVLSTCRLDFLPCLLLIFHFRSCFFACCTPLCTYYFTCANLIFSSAIIDGLHYEIRVFTPMRTYHQIW